MTLCIWLLCSTSMAHTPSACPNWSNVDEQWRQGCQGGGYWTAQHAEHFNRLGNFIPIRFIIINNTNQPLAFKRANICQVAQPSKKDNPLLLLQPKDDPMRKHNSGEAALSYKIYQGKQCNNNSDIAKVSVQYGSPPSINAANRTWSMVYNSLINRIEMSSHDVSELYTFPNYPAILINDSKHEIAPAIASYRNILVPSLISSGSKATTKNPNLYKFPNVKKYLYYNMPEFGPAGAGSDPAKDYGGLLGTFITANVKQKNYSFQWCYFDTNNNNRCKPSILSQKKITHSLSKLNNDSPMKYKDFIITINPIPKNSTPYREIYSFGDSITDTHNTYLLSKGDLPRGPFYNGRWTDGLSWADYVTKYSGIPLRNYAFGGARIQAPTNNNTSSRAIAGFKDWAAGWFMPNGLPYIPSVGQQIAMATPEIKNSLQKGNVVATVFAGANDILEAMAGPKEAFPDSTCKLYIKKKHKDVGACMAQAMLNNLNKLSHAALNSAHSLQVHVMLLPDITIASQVFYYIKRHEKKNHITRAMVQAWITRYNTILKNHFAHHNRLNSAQHFSSEKTSPNIKWVIDPIDKLIQTTLQNPLFYGFAAYGPVFKPTQHWGPNFSPKAVFNSANALGFTTMTPHHKLHPTKGHMEGWLDIPSLIYYNPENNTKNIIGGGLHPSTIMQFILASNMMYSLYLSSKLSKAHDFSSDPTAQLMIQTKGYKFNNTKQFNKQLEQLRQISQQLPEWATFSSPMPRQKTGTWNNGCTGAYAANNGLVCRLSAPSKNQGSK